MTKSFCDCCGLEITDGTDRRILASLMGAPLDIRQLCLQCFQNWQTSVKTFFAKAGA